MLDAGSDTHICNNRDRPIAYEPNAIEAAPDARETQLPIIGYNQVHLRIKEVSSY